MYRASPYADRFQLPPLPGCVGDGGDDTYPATQPAPTVTAALQSDDDDDGSSVHTHDTIGTHTSSDNSAGEEDDDDVDDYLLI